MASNSDLIIKLRADTKQLSKDLAKAKARMNTFNKNMSRIGRNLQSTMLTAFGGAAVLQGITSVVRNLADFELQMAKVEAISGATSKEVSELTENALELGRTTKFTAGEIASLQLELSKLGFNTQQILESTNAIQQLSLVTGEDLAESAKSMAGTLRSFNLEAEESERVSNAMAESFSKSALTLEKFTVGTANSGAIANALGVTLEQNTARLGKLVDANIDASKAGTDLRKIYIDLNKAGINYDTALELVSQSSDKVATATELVGIRAAGALVILSEQKDEVKQLALELANTNTEMGGMADVINNTLSVSFDKLKSALDGVLKEGSVFNDWLKEATDLATEFVQKSTESISENQFRKAIESGAEAWSKYSQNVETANKFIDFNKDKLDKLRAAVTQYELKLRLSGKTLNENKKEYRDLKAPMLELEAAVKGAEEVVKRHNEQLKIENDLLEKQKKAAKEAKEQLDKLNAIKTAGSAITNQTAVGSNLSVGGVTKQTLKADQVEGRIAEAQYAEMERRKWAAIVEQAQIGSQMLIDLNNTLAVILAQTGADMIAGFANAIGAGDGINAAFDVLATVFADGLQRMGKALIQYGVLMIAAKAALSNPFANIGGVGAIAAGAVAVAAGAALKSSISSSGSSTISAGGGGRGSGAGFSDNRIGQTVSVNGKFVVEGKDLVLAIDNQNRSDGRNKG